jgi:hypothetical protein
MTLYQRIYASKVKAKKQRAGVFGVINGIHGNSGNAG